MNNDDKMCYLWTTRPDISNEGIHVLVEFKLIQSHAISDVQHTYASIYKDHPNVRQHVTIITQMVFDEPSMLYPNVQEDDEDDDADYDVSSASDNNNDDNDEEDDVSIPLNPLSSILVN
ncbi:hypothetical protein M9H77_04574 [Catharanthus roseus]|uniref:Uncharacterized protein n=1 Tax=Catharanthus roseus TaxID=4058 RepID=A0ACC0CEH3_CATRO|nr:hypothetical protein M9H77_04574 [Catharanthus roseus]